MFSQTAEYALRAAVALAAAEESLPVSELAARTGVPPQYLSKVLQGLKAAGLLQARRGKRGGYRLGRPAAEISVLDVLNATAPLPRIHHCPLGLPEHERLCPLHRQLDDAAAAVEERLRGCPLSELVESFAPLSPPA